MLPDKFNPTYPPYGHSISLCTKWLVPRKEYLPAVVKKDKAMTSDNAEESGTGLHTDFFLRQQHFFCAAHFVVSMRSADVSGKLSGRARALARNLTLADAGIHDSEAPKGERIESILIVLSEFLSSFVVQFLSSFVGIKYPSNPFYPCSNEINV